MNNSKKMDKVTYILLNNSFQYRQKQIKFIHVHIFLLYLMYDINVKIETPLPYLVKHFNSYCWR